jgi:hypothetical protein
MTDKTVIAKVVSKDNDDIDNIVGLPRIIQSKQASLAFLPKHLGKVRGQFKASTKTNDHRDKIMSTNNKIQTDSSNQCFDDNHRNQFDDPQCAKKPTPNHVSKDEGNDIPFEGQLSNTWSIKQSPWLIKLGHYLFLNSLMNTQRFLK